MSDSRAKKDLSAALALLVLTGSAITSIPASADETQGATSGAYEIDAADDILAGVEKDPTLSEEANQKIEEARKLLRQSAIQEKVDAERPTCF